VRRRGKLGHPATVSGSPALGQGGLIHVEAGTPLQIKNEGDEELLLYIHGWPPESEHAEILDSVV
jgi:mannose-6-phosphate isomerase-like protein (cupin superfamily)